MSHGRLAVAGSSLRVENARDAQKPPMPSGEIGGLRSAGDHDVGVAVLDEPRRLADAVVGGRARADGAEVRALVAVVDRHETGDHVDDRARHEERRDLAQAALRGKVVRLFDHRQPADARADAHARALLVAGEAFETGILHRLHRRDEAVMDERVVAARFLARQVLRDVEALHLTGDPRRESPRRRSA